MKAEKIYLDMDGVLVDFDRGVRELCGMDPLPQTGKTDPHQDDLMWEAIRKVGHFYDRLELMPGAKEMFDTLRKKYGDKVEILTGIPREERGIVTAAEDKRNWTARLLSDKVKVNSALKLTGKVSKNSSFSSYIYSVFAMAFPLTTSALTISCSRL